MTVPHVVRLLDEFPPQHIYQMANTNFHDLMRSHRILLRMVALIKYDQSIEELQMDIYSSIEYMWPKMYALLKKEETWQSLSENEGQDLELYCALMLKYWRFETYTELMLTNQL